MIETVEASGGGVAGREMNLRYAGICSACGGEIPRGIRALYSSGDRSVRHLSCPGLDRGTAGGSARREFDRRKDRDDARVAAEKQNIRATFGDGLIGRVATLLAVDDSPRRSTSVWQQGAVGEERVAARLDALERVGVQALHDRRIPGTRANIDHLAITPWGVWVIDAKRYLRQKPAFYTEGGFFGFGGTNRLTVGGRKQDKLVDGVLRQVERVQAALGGAATVGGILCFVEADWPLVGGDFSVRGVRVVWPGRLAKELLRTTPPIIDPESISRALAAKFPAA